MKVTYAKVQAALEQLVVLGEIEVVQPCIVSVPASWVGTFIPLERFAPIERVYRSVKKTEAQA